MLTKQLLQQAFTPAMAPIMVLAALCYLDRLRALNEDVVGSPGFEVRLFVVAVRIAWKVWVDREARQEVGGTTWWEEIGGIPAGELRVMEMEVSSQKCTCSLVRCNRL